jgi:hypothetical protein
MRILRAHHCSIDRLQDQTTGSVSAMPTGLPRLWGQLPMEKRRQLAQLIGQLVRRLRQTLPREVGGHRADHDVVL